MGCAAVQDYRGEFGLGKFDGSIGKWKTEYLIKWSIWDDHWRKTLHRLEITFQKIKLRNIQKCYYQSELLSNFPIVKMTNFNLRRLSDTALMGFDWLLKLEMGLCEDLSWYFVDYRFFFHWHIFGHVCDMPNWKWACTLTCQKIYWNLVVFAGNLWKASRHYESLHNELGVKII